MKYFILLLVLLLGGCSLTQEQKARVADERTNQFVQKHYDAIGHRDDIRKAIREQYGQ
jgi:hypothetical protein